MAVRRTLGLALAMVLVVTVASCRHRHSKDTTVVDQPQRFSLSQELHSEHDTDWYGWSTTLDQARVEFRVRHFTEGWAKVRIYDDAGLKVFDEEYFQSSYHCDCDHEFTEVDFTGIGTPGDWQIRVDVHDFSGSLYLTLD